MTPREYKPSIIHITFDGENRLCRGKIPVTSWGDADMRKNNLPVCELCKIVYENEFGRQYVKGKTIATIRSIGDTGKYRAKKTSVNFISWRFMF